jgi:hypothetical protein
MSTKIFPFRRYNPDKGRAATGLPDTPPPSQEEQRIMRQLLAEQAALALAKRAAALPSAPAKIEPQPVPVSIWGFEPEYVIAYDELLNRTSKRSGPPAKRRALEVAADFLRRFRKGERSACEMCKFDLTSDDPEGLLVPHGLFVWEQPGEIRASALCRDCCARAAESRFATDGTIKDDQPITLTVVEWMASKEALSGKLLPTVRQPKGKRP